MEKWKYTVGERCFGAPVGGQRRNRTAGCLNCISAKKVHCKIPLLQLKPGVPLPSPKDLLGKILIKNKKKQSVSEKRQNSMKKGKNVEPEIIEQPAFMDAEDTGMSEGGNGTSTAR